MASLERLLVHLKAQSAPLDELKEVIVTHPGYSLEEQLRLEKAAGRGLRFVALAPETDYYGAKNAGFDASTAEVVVFGDSDCWPEETWLERMLAPFSRQSVRVVAGRTCYRAGVLGSAASSIDFNYYPSPLGKGCTRNFYANNVAFRREVFAAHRYGAAEHFYRGNCQTLGLRLLAAGVAVRFEPRAKTTHRFPDSVAEFVELRMRRGGDLVEISPALLDAYLPRAKELPAPLGAACVWGLRVAFSLGAVGRQGLPRLGWRWPAAAAGTLGICALDGMGAAARLLGRTTPEGGALSYHADVDRLAAA